MSKSKSECKRDYPLDGFSRDIKLWKIIRFIAEEKAISVSEFIQLIWEDLGFLIIYFVLQFV